MRCCLAKVGLLQLTSSCSSSELVQDLPHEMQHCTCVYWRLTKTDPAMAWLAGVGTTAFRYGILEQDYDIIIK